MKPSEIETHWTSVEPPDRPSSGSLNGISVTSDFIDDETLLAVDGHGLRHLLIPAVGGSKIPAHAKAKGLEIDIHELAVAERSAQLYWDIACQDAGMNATFTLVTVEILEQLANSVEPTKAIDQVLARWIWFWGVPSTGMTEEKIVGLFGELWFLDVWLGPIDSEVVTAWTGSTPDRHDFKWPNASIEVKSTRTKSDGPSSHRITSLEQLAPPEQGDLYLFSLRISPDPIGSHSLNSSVDRLRGQLQNRPDILSRFDERLAEYGYSPSQRDRYDERLVVNAEELYRVDTGFPRLTSGSFEPGIPAGIDHVSYVLDLAACQDWRVATEPGVESSNLCDSLRGT